MPTVIYTAVKALITNDECKVLVLKQSDPTISGANQYHPPGGILEFGETLAECVMREVEEEIGVTPAIGNLFDVGEWTATRNDTHMQFVGLFYTCTIPTYEFTLQDEEVSHARWVGAAEIDSIDILEPSKSIIKRFLQSR